MKLENRLWRFCVNANNLFAIYFDMSFHTIISGEWLRKGNASDKKGMRQGDNEKGRGNHKKGEEEKDKTQKG